MIDFDTWINEFGTKHILRMLEIRRAGQWTPYEMEKKFIDESLYKDSHYTHIQIKEVIKLPDNDILIGYREVYDLDSIEEDWEKSTIYYKKFSEIEIRYFPQDDDISNWE